jgi:formylglycine-generating enzyme required for sulfatase activity
MKPLLLVFLVACTSTDVPQDSGADTATDPHWVRVAPGSFTIGCTQAQTPFCEQEEEGPTHEVTLTRGFFMGKKEVTQADFETRMGFNPSENPNCDTCPVEQVRFDQAMMFANAKSQSDGLALCYRCPEDQCTPVDAFLDCRGYRLPTNAEWEWAARASTDLLFSGSDNAFDVAWTAHSSTGNTQPVGELLANDWGLFDLSGNVWEMVNDWYSPYASSPQTDPLGPEGGALRTLRGGAWNLDPEHARVSNRWDYLEDAGNNVGFRLVRSDIAAD